MSSWKLDWDGGLALGKTSISRGTTGFQAHYLSNSSNLHLFLSNKLRWLIRLTNHPIPGTDLLLSKYARLLTMSVFWTLICHLSKTKISWHACLPKTASSVFKEHTGMPLILRTWAMPKKNLLQISMLTTNIGRLSSIKTIILDFLCGLGRPLLTNFL